MKWVFWASASLIIYTYVGYLVWLWMRAKLRPWPVLHGSVEPSVSIVMIVRNEEKALRRKIQNLLELDYPADRYEVVIVSDGSTDGTNAILREFAEREKVRAIVKESSQGKASGLNDAFSVAQGEVTVFTDVRQQIELGAMRLLLENLADPAVGCVSGELMLGEPGAGESQHGMGIYWRLEKKVRELESASGSVVGATGAFYAARRALLTSVPEGTILDDVYLPMQVVRQGKRVVFEPRAKAWDKPDLGAEREFARKVRTLSGNYQLLELAPWLLGRENPIRFEFISHKLLRLVVPLALLLVFISSVVVAEPFYRVCAVLQFAFYALGVSAIVPFKLGLLSRLSDAASTFVVLNTAAAIAFANFVMGKKVVWTR